MKISGFVAAGIAAVATVAFSSVPAFAGEDTMVHTTDAGWGGKAFFKGYGDQLKVCDLVADGMTPEVVMQWGGLGVSLRANGGKGTCNAKTKDLPEGTTIKIRVCLLDHNLENHNCSRWTLGSS